MTFAQARQQENRDLRAARRTYRHADTSGEILERELDRLIGKRKKIVTPKELLPLLRKYENYAGKVLVFEAALALLAIRLSRYVIR